MAYGHFLSVCCKIQEFIFRMVQHEQCLGTVSKMGFGHIRMAKKVVDIHFTAGTQQH